ncbi:bifunctional 4-hydroxy-2-oxoglutarate aldolase/2-dehydro-3-deoxy-phosphogluconate aldolase [Tessaracoccus sp. MC1756]|uniref:bifunctional 4-hydroxy-2-oxoglutarate aldolase/2-dehydro-3-deoxy-phosphogluconate aldolase n=1 Tax=Tessaracoccus sp. MC1756 TaxID=2760311 RepID=UPI001603B054|nr:bifunctional 4-hydroxy-2-oxoglutarate aldolase/2-dehydro-3-deoxy-phosphogluconate aldolase [Tessaracoccus sp. MC1756]MBB1510977.1 bifunctional 4-hydroxy-2-oxoglutarate aldolase/2-dehydro-3-deoxy-phosphogluconate aldolase [Tessaracoccus sp. MC1756]
MMSDSARPFGVAILRGQDSREALAAAERCLQHGISYIEVALQSHESLLQITALRDTFPTATVGAGTVVRAAQVAQAQQAGAQFLFAPNLSRAVSTQAIDRGVPYIPGVATPSEVAEAEEMGWTLQKMFPAQLLTAEWIKAMHSPLPGPKFIATGGVDADNAASFLQAGAIGLGLGSCLKDHKQLEDIAALLREAQ